MKKSSKVLDLHSILAKGGRDRARGGQGYFNKQILSLFYPSLACKNTLYPSLYLVASVDCLIKNSLKIQIQGRETNVQLMLWVLCSAIVGLVPDARLDVR